MCVKRYEWLISYFLHKFFSQRFAFSLKFYAYNFFAHFSTFLIRITAFFHVKISESYLLQHIYFVAFPRLYAAITYSPCTTENFIAFRYLLLTSVLRTNVCIYSYLPFKHNQSLNKKIFNWFLKKVFFFFDWFFFIANKVVRERSASLVASKCVKSDFGTQKLRVVHITLSSSRVFTLVAGMLLTVI